MFNFFLNSAPLSIGEKLSIGGQVTLLGMGTVFSVLILLWGLVELLHLILGQKPTKKVNKAVPVTATEEVSVAETQTANNDLEIIAVITAAIAAASGSSPSSFRVVSFKRANNRFSNRK